MVYIIFICSTILYFGLQVAKKFVDYYDFTSAPSSNIKSKINFSEFIKLKNEKPDWVIINPKSKWLRVMMEIMFFMLPPLIFASSFFALLETYINNFAYEFNSETTIGEMETAIQKIKHWTNPFSFMNGLGLAAGLAILFLSALFPILRRAKIGQRFSRARKLLFTSYYFFSILSLFTFFGAPILLEQEIIRKKVEVKIETIKSKYNDNIYKIAEQVAEEVIDEIFSDDLATKAIENEKIVLEGRSYVRAHRFESTAKNQARGKYYAVLGRLLDKVYASTNEAFNHTQTNTNSGGNEEPINDWLSTPPKPKGPPPHNPNNGANTSDPAPQNPFPIVDLPYSEGKDAIVLHDLTVNEKDWNEKDADLIAEKLDEIGEKLSKPTPDGEIVNIKNRSLYISSIQKLTIGIVNGILGVTKDLAFDSPIVDIIFDAVYEKSIKSKISGYVKSVLEKNFDLAASKLLNIHKDVNSSLKANFVSNPDVIQDIAFEMDKFSHEFNKERSEYEVNLERINLQEIKDDQLVYEKHAISENTTPEHTISENAISSALSINDENFKKLIFEMLKNLGYEGLSQNDVILDRLSQYLKENYAEAPTSTSINNLSRYQLLQASLQRARYKNYYTYDINRQGFYRMNNTINWQRNAYYRTSIPKTHFYIRSFPIIRFR